MTNTCIPQILSEIKSHHFSNFNFSRTSCFITQVELLYKIILILHNQHDHFFLYKFTVTIWIGRALYIFRIEQAKLVIRIFQKGKHEK